MLRAHRYTVTCQRDSTVTVVHVVAVNRAGAIREAVQAMGTAEFVIVSFTEGWDGKEIDGSEKE